MVRSDNTTTCAYINRQGGTRSWELCAQAVRLWLWCLDHQISIRAVYLPGVDNVEADSLSRGWGQASFAEALDHREWELHKEVLKSVFLMLGQSQIDLFANRSNTRLPHFCSLIPKQGADAVDAFSIPWTHFLGYAFPPWVMIPKVVDKVVRDQATLILIAPEWPDRPWFSALLHMLVEMPVRLTPRQDLLFQRGKYHLRPEFFKLVAWKITGLPSAAKEFRKRLLGSQNTPWCLAPGQSTKPSSTRSAIGAVNGVWIPCLSI